MCDRLTYAMTGMFTCGYGRRAVRVEDDLDGARRMRRCGSGWAARSTRSNLSKKNATAFRRKLAPLIEHARKLDGPAPWACAYPTNPLTQ